MKRPIAIVVLSLIVGSSALAERRLLQDGRELPNGVPNHSQSDFAGDNDCGPTAVNMLLGYYDANGWPNFVENSRPYYTAGTGPSAGIAALDRLVKNNIPYRGSAGTYSLDYSMNRDVARVARTMDSGARWWGGSDDESVSQDSIRNEIRAGRPLLLLVKSGPFQFWFMEDNGSWWQGSINWHWMTVLGYDDTSDFWTVVRSGWRKGGNSMLWYYWGFWDDLITVRVFSNGAPETSVGPHLLTSLPDGSAYLNRVDAAETRVIGQRLMGRYPTWTATCYDRTETAPGRLLWSRTDGLASLWTLDRYDNFADYRLFGPYQGWTARSVQTLRDGRIVLLWAHDSGYASVWILDAGYNWAGGFGASLNGWHARSLQATLDSQGRLTVALLFDDKNGSAKVAEYDGSGWALASRTYGSHAGDGSWRAMSYRRYTNGTSRLLWNHSWGMSDVEKLSGWTVNGQLAEYAYGHYNDYWGGATFQSFCER